MSKNLSVKNYKENKERLQKEARGRYQNLSKKEKETKQQCGCERYKNLSEDEEQKLAEYREDIIKWVKSNPFFFFKKKKENLKCRFW